MKLSFFKLNILVVLKVVMGGRDTTVVEVEEVEEDEVDILVCREGVCENLCMKQKQKSL